MKRIAVTSLCEFAARSGDLDFRYTPAPSALEGIAGHQRVRRRRGRHYRAEVRLEGECEGVPLGGRADGYDPNAGMLEEIKTYRGKLERIPAAQRALHWAQLRVYGALLCMAENLENVELRLTYFEIGRGRETHFSEQASAAELQRQLVELCCAYRAWHEIEQQHRRVRDAALARLKFPYDDFRRGQRDLAETVFKTLCVGGRVLLQAPTGLGKTLGTVYPALMASARSGVDRVFYLTSRNTIRGLALEALAQIFQAQEEALPLRVLEFNARTQSCEYPDLACHGEACPLARGFFDRLPDARQAAIEVDGVLDQSRLREIALANEICPYYLAQEMARWCDVVVADVNRFFDQSAILYGLTVQNQHQVSLLIDEAHNLVERGRAMYSAAMNQQRLLAVKKNAPAELRRPISAFARRWTGLIAEHDLGAADSKSPEPVYLEQPPAELCAAAQGLAGALIDYLAEQRGDAALQELLFELLGFTGLAESFGEHSLCRLDRPRRGRARLEIINQVPADFLAPRFAAAQSSVLFSATLQPPRYYLDLLGLDETTRWQAIDSPFTAEQLEVQLAGHISTRLADREASIQPIVELLALQYAHRPANYLIYFSSFAYLESVYLRLTAEHPDILAWRQEPGMREAARAGFIDRFRPHGQGIGFAVLGGAFAEGIDLPGTRLSGVFVATLGLPPFDDAHRRLSERLQARYGAGYDYTWLYPGLQKVAQAAGRVIRTPEDRGVIVLIDDRFRRGEVQALLPRWWPRAEVLPAN